jgi:hypothetical protein
MYNLAMSHPTTMPVAATPNSPALTSAASSADSPVTSSGNYLPCRCVGVLPGRACSWCLSTKWLKRCTRCHGAGFWFKNNRQGDPRQEPCGDCGKRGWKAVGPKEREQAEREYAAAQAIHIEITEPDPDTTVNFSEPVTDTIPSKKSKK